MKVLVTDKINNIAGKIIEETAQVDFMETMSEDELCKIIGEYDALMVRSQTKVTPKIIQAAHNMKIIGRAGVGVDNIDIDEATKKGIIVVNSPEGNTTAAAEHTVAMMLAMTRHIPQADASVKQGKWERSKFTGNEVFNKTLGIIGLGKIGHRVAKAALALGMKLVIYDPYSSKEAVEAIGGTYVKSLDEFWPLCDYITVHVPKTRETAYLINRNSLNRMKKGVRLVNCARGGIIEEAALKEALESGQVASAAIDVYENEPNIETCPLLTCDGQVVLTPHLGASTKEAQLNVAIDVAEQIRDVLGGGNARSAVNIPSLRSDILENVKEYMPLAENIGSLVSQITKGAPKSIEIIVNGHLAAFDIAPLKTAILKGVLSTSLEGVNYVNAPIIAKNRGINIIDTKSETGTNYNGMITVKLITDAENRTVSGAMIAENTPRIVKIDEYNMSIAPATHSLVIPHENKPAMIAKVATILGEANVNISMMQVAENAQKGASTMVINIDTLVGADILEKIQKVDGVYSAQYVKLSV